MKIQELDTPAVIVDLDLLESNIGRLSRYADEHGLRPRPHTKTHKIPAIAQMQIASGCQGITVAKAGEAEVMANAGIDDILVHYPVFGVEKLKRLAILAKTRKITIAVDSLITAQAISDAAAESKSTIHLLVEFDAGMRRCGLQSPEEVENLAGTIQRLPHVTFAGVTMYPGHIWVSPDEQAAVLGVVTGKVASVLERLDRAGIQCETVSGGSTPTAHNSHLIEPDRNPPGHVRLQRSKYAWRGRMRPISMRASRDGDGGE
jgi:D-serine deaminase-like pyridoxal phosphate-dependent protein